MRDAARHIEKARRILASGRHLLAGDATGPYADEAGRDAYMAAYHAAQAFIVARTGKEPKTHRGTQSEFARLVHAEAIDHVFVSFLSQSYELKGVADYDDGDPVTVEEARAALD